ncbi:MAG TPA: PAS domain-containing protein [Candidatus Methylacidiphilales bacterium]|nr:PAS domain-containing protein [Candidatus Methylacidiphilales bacterium]
MDSDASTSIQQAEELARANRALVDNEQRLRLAIATGRIGLWVWNSSDVANAGDWSLRLKEIFGLDGDTEITHDLFLKCVHPEDRDRVHQAVMQALGGANNGEYAAEYRVVRQNDGGVRWVTARAQAFLDAQGNPFRFIGTLMDITDRKEAEQAAARQNAELEERIAERTADLEHANKALQQEVEERRRAEIALRRSEDYLRTVIDTVPGLVWSSLPGGDIEYLNKRWLEYTGMTLETARGWGWQTAIHPDDLPGLTNYWKYILAAEIQGETEARMRRYDGEYRWFLFRGVPLHNDEGHVVKWYGSTTDIQALRNTEHVARGQLSALERTLSAMANESEPDKLLEHVLRMFANQLHGQSVSVWDRTAEDQLLLVATFEDGVVRMPAQNAGLLDGTGIMTQNHPVWREVFRTGSDCVLGDLTQDPPRLRLSRENATWHNWSEGVAPQFLEPITQITRRLTSLGVVASLTVPMLVAGRVAGLIGVRVRQREPFRPEEIELARALAHQAMLAIQLMRLSQESREAAVAAERNRFARDIHDTLAQGFTGVIVQLEAAEDAGVAAAERGLVNPASSLAQEAIAHIARARELARESLQEARRSVHALRPQALTEKDLCRAMEDLIARQTAGTAVRGIFACRGNAIELPIDWQDNLLRICQESLTNALRHAHATQFSALLDFSDKEEVVLQFSDNGIGVDSTRHHRDGFGLLGMRERAESIGGIFSITSPPLKAVPAGIIKPDLQQIELLADNGYQHSTGTVIRVVLPLASRA